MLFFLRDGENTCQPSYLPNYRWSSPSPFSSSSSSCNNRIIYRIIHACIHAFMQSLVVWDQELSDQNDHRSCDRFNRWASPPHRHRIIGILRWYIIGRKQRSCLTHASVCVSKGTSTCTILQIINDGSKVSVRHITILNILLIMHVICTYSD